MTAGRQRELSSRGFVMLVTLVGAAACTPTIRIGLDATPADDNSYVVYLLDTLTAPQDGFRTQTVMLTGAGIPESEWGADSIGGRRGVVELDNSSLRLRRDALLVCDPASDVPPDCMYSASEMPGRYTYADHTVFPFGADNNLEFGALRRVKAHFSITLLSALGYTDCGFGFAFGSDVPSAAPYANALALPKDLHLCGRAAGLDFFRIMYRVQGSLQPASVDSLVVDAPINAEAGGTVASASEWYGDAFTAQAGDHVKHHGDFIEFDVALSFDHASHNLTITVTPTAGGSASAPVVDAAAWRPQSVVWDMAAPLDATSAGQRRAGLAFASFFADCNSYEKLMRQTVAIGATFNGAPRECTMSGLEIEMSGSP
jgi:hypothetical protein